MLCRLFLWWRYECQRRWDMNLTSALARVEFESAVFVFRCKKIFYEDFHFN
jgi:hypothetical protein